MPVQCSPFSQHLVCRASPNPRFSRQQIYNRDTADTYLPRRLDSTNRVSCFYLSRCLWSCTVQTGPLIPQQRQSYQIGLAFTSIDQYHCTRNGGTVIMVAKANRVPKGRWGHTYPITHVKRDRYIFHAPRKNKVPLTGTSRKTFYKMIELVTLPTCVIPNKRLYPNDFLINFLWHSHTASTKLQAAPDCSNRCSRYET